MNEFKTVNNLNLISSIIETWKELEKKEKKKEISLHSLFLLLSGAKLPTHVFSCHHILLYIYTRSP